MNVCERVETGFSAYLTEEWRASLGCTEPAAIAHAAALAAGHRDGRIRMVRLVCDARNYKNCYSVGIPNSGVMALGTMVGNLAGMICDGAKIGCAMKTMTGVDAAFRAANLAMLGLGVPATDGIVGVDGNASLLNLGRLARRGMADTDAEILAIMQGKLKQRPPSPAIAEAAGNPSWA